jgi:hypothetical protein
LTKIPLTAALMAFALVAAAKLPPLDDAAKAKAAEAAAKAAWQAKLDGYQLCKAQDRVAAYYRKTSGSPTTAKDAADAKSVKTPAAPPAASTPAAAASGTPVAASAPTPGTDPGAFAYNAPEQKPLETSAAHSPAGTAASPPSVRPESAKMAPSK